MASRIEFLWNFFGSADAPRLTASEPKNCRRSGVTFQCGARPIDIHPASVSGEERDRQPAPDSYVSYRALESMFGSFSLVDLTSVESWPIFVRSGLGTSKTITRVT